MNKEQFEKIYQDCKAEADSGYSTLEDEVIIYAKEMIVELESELKQKERKMLTMTAAQIREALEFVNPDGIESEEGKEQQEAELTFFYRDIDGVATDGDPLPRGIYCYLSEYPEEGCYGPLDV